MELERRRIEVSVVIPAYEARDFIVASVASALSQTHAPAEVIVVDDGSTDGTPELVEERFPDVRVVRIDHGGEAAARNAGLEAARSEWVAYLDADDRFLPERLEAMLDVVVADPSLDAVTTDAFMEVAGEIRGLCYGPAYEFAHDHQDEEILRQNFVFGHVLARRERLLDLGGYDTTISHTTDWAMWARLILDGGRVGFVDRPLSVYRVHIRSASADRVRMLEGSLATMDAIASGAGLTTTQETVLAETQADYRRRLAAARASSALDDPTDEALAAADEVAADHVQPHSARLKARATRLAPGLMGRAQRVRRRGLVNATAGWLIPSGADQADDDRPLVSVVLPFLDEIRFLEGAVDTVSAQSTSSWELILVDDGSTDGSGALADELAGGHPQIRVVRHQGGANRGLAESRNRGLADARAATVAFLDADDRWETDKLERQLRLLGAHPEVGMVAGATRHRFFDTDAPDEIHRIADFGPGVLPVRRFATALVREAIPVPPPPSSVLYRTSLLRSIGGVPAGNSTYEDQRTFIMASLAAPTLIDDAVVTTYARRGDSIYGRLANDNVTKSRERRDFEWWILKQVPRLSSNRLGALCIALSLVVHRLTSAVLRRLSPARRAAHRAVPPEESP